MRTREKQTVRIGHERLTVERNVWVDFHSSKRTETVYWTVSRKLRPIDLGGFGLCAQSEVVASGTTREEAIEKAKAKLTTA